MTEAKARALVWWAIIALTTVFWFAVCFFVVPKCVLAQTNAIGIQFSHGNEPDLKGFRVYYGKTTGTYGIGYWISLSDYIAPPEYMTLPIQLVAGDYFFAATAVDTSDNESPYSAEATLTVPDTKPSPCQGLKINIPTP